MKKLFFLLIIIALSTVLELSTTSCSRKSGCPAYENLKAPVNRKGELSGKGGNTSLFPKDMKKGKKKKKN